MAAAAALPDDASQGSLSAAAEPPPPPGGGAGECAGLRAGENESGFAGAAPEGAGFHGSLSEKKTTLYTSLKLLIRNIFLVFLQAAAKCSHKSDD